MERNTLLNLSVAGATSQLYFSKNLEENRAEVHRAQTRWMCQGPEYLNPHLKALNKLDEHTGLSFQSFSFSRHRYHLNILRFHSLFSVDWGTLLYCIFSITLVLTNQLLTSTTNQLKRTQLQLIQTAMFRTCWFQQFHLLLTVFPAACSQQQIPIFSQTKQINKNKMFSQEFYFFDF